MESWRDNYKKTYAVIGYSIRAMQKLAQNSPNAILKTW